MHWSHRAKACRGNVDPPREVPPAAVRSALPWGREGVTPLWPSAAARLERTVVPPFARGTRGREPRPTISLPLRVPISTLKGQGDMAQASTAPSQYQGFGNTQRRDPWY